MKKLSKRHGQAAVEFLIGLVALLALIAGLIQVISLSTARTNTMVAARREAGKAAIAPSTGYLVPPEYRTTLYAGADGKRYTADDWADVSADREARFKNVIVAPSAQSADWAFIDSRPDNYISILNQSAAPVQEFGLVSGSSDTKTNLLPAVRHLLYAAPSITVKSTVWMAKTKDIY
jgi:hypothetical protein